MFPELGHDDLVRTFVQMMRRKYLNVSANEMHLNFTPDELISRLDKMGVDTTASNLKTLS